LKIILQTGELTSGVTSEQNILQKNLENYFIKVDEDFVYTQ